MTKVEIYSADYCPYCHKAKQLLLEKGVTYTQYDVAQQPEFRKECQNRSGKHTIPQIFINDKHIGGCDDLYALDSDNTLDLLLKG